jgi:hypothetical protein
VSPCGTPVRDTEAGSLHTKYRLYLTYLKYGN